jgi:hypothetical protein
MSFDALAAPHVHGECGTGQSADERAALMMGLACATVTIDYRNADSTNLSSAYVHADPQVSSGPIGPIHFCGHLARQQFGTDLHHQSNNRPELQHQHSPRSREGWARASWRRPDTDEFLFPRARVPHDRSLARSNPESLQPRQPRAPRCAGERGASYGFVLSPGHPARS